MLIYSTIDDHLNKYIHIKLWFQARWHISVISAVGRLRQDNCFGFQASLGYTVSFKTAWAESKNDLRKPE